MSTPLSFSPPHALPVRAPPSRRARGRRWPVCTASSVHVTRRARSDAGAPPLVFVAGLDGAPLAAVQAARLRARYRITSIAHAPGVLTGWDALVADAAAVVAAEGPGVVLVGESFGAALALRVAAAAPAGAVARLVLVNSATALAADAPLAAATRLLPLLRADGSGRVLYRAAAEVLQRGFLTGGGGALDPRASRVLDIDRVPLETMLHRVALLRAFGETFGDDCVARLVRVPTTLVASGNDRLLRSEAEMARLRTLLPNVEREVVLPGAAHACLLERDVDLAELVDGGGSGGRAASMATESASAVVSATAASRAPGAVGETDAARGGEREADALSYQEARELGGRFLTPLKALVDPVFSGRDHVVQAIRECEESGRPVLFVGNHGVYGLLDTPLLIEELGRLVGPSRRLRALAHETHFAQFSDLTGGRWGRFFSSLGAVPATARNFYRLLRSGEPVLLFPGGPTEVCRRRGQKNTLRWRDATDFVRPAARLNAIIVPFSSAGVDDAIDLIIDGQEMQRLPVVGPALTQLLKDNNFDPEQWVPARNLCSQWHVCLFRTLLSLRCRTDCALVFACDASLHFLHFLSQV